MTDTLLGYEALLRDLKNRIRSARIRSALAVNRELVLLNWQIGREILARQEAEEWGPRSSNALAPSSPTLATPTSSASMQKLINWFMPYLTLMPTKLALLR